MTTDAVGGVWTYSLELARALLAEDVEIALAAMGPPPDLAQIDEARSIPNLTLYAGAYKLEWMEEPWDDVERAGEWLLSLAERERPDMVHLNGYAHASLEWNTPCLVVGHSCVLSWWEAVKGEPAPQRWNRYRQAVTEGLRSADMVLAPTQAMLSALDHHYGPLWSAKVVPNCRRGTAYSTGPKEPFIFTAGRAWDAAKNITALERVASRLHWPVYVAGDQEHPAGGSAALENVRKLGKLGPAAMPLWYARASIYALPARYEPFGLSALEAALSGCALVLGDISSLREVWDDAAIFVPPDDDEQLEQAMNGLIEDPVRLNEMSDRAWVRAKQYPPERTAREYLAAVRGAGLAPASRHRLRAGWTT